LLHDRLAKCVNTHGNWNDWGLSKSYILYTKFNTKDLEALEQLRHQKPLVRTTVTRHLRKSRLSLNLENVTYFERANGNGNFYTSFVKKCIKWMHNGNVVFIHVSIRLHILSSKLLNRFRWNLVLWVYTTVANEFSRIWGSHSGGNEEFYCLITRPWRWKRHVSETSADFQRVTQRYISEDRTLHQLSSFGSCKSLVSTNIFTFSNAAESINRTYDVQFEHDIKYRPISN
jgi:hypothetical protein